MSAREIVARALYASLDRLTTWDELAQDQQDYYMRLADGAIAVSKPFNAAVWFAGYDAAYSELIEGIQSSNPFEE